MLLNDGTEMPSIAYGLYLVQKDDAARCVADAVKASYTHFDGAAFYANEKEAGRALPDDAWYTTKVWTTDSSFDDAVASVKRSRAELGRDLDLALVHWPVPDKHVEIYRALVHCKEELKIVKRVGLSNYTQEDYEELERSGLTKRCPPVVNQLEVSPLLYRKACVDYFQEKHVVVQAFKPLQRGAALDNPVVTALALKNGVTPAQVLIKWGLQKGLCVCVKSSSPTRMAENVDVDAFWGLDMDAMDELDALTTDAALKAWRAHYEKWRAGTDGPWGPGPRPALADVAPVESVPAPPSMPAEPEAEPPSAPPAEVPAPAAAPKRPASPEPAAAAPPPKRARVVHSFGELGGVREHDEAPAAAAAEPLDEAAIKKMTVPKLRAALTARGLDTTGLKAALLARLREAIA